MTAILRRLFTRDGPFEPIGRAYRSFMDEPLPAGVGWSRVFGSVLLFLFLLQLLTGLLLAVYYSPSSETAWESVRFIESQVLFGRLIRGLHHWSASVFIVVLALHLAQTFLSGSFKRPRQATWIFGCVLPLLGLAFGYTGYLLPWDLRAYF
jgi:ubiquinol-cytochrome c reductase cytochrome b subunit